MRRFAGAFLIAALALAANLVLERGGARVHGSATLEHERLRLRNDFKKPEEVVNYYCARDASGFVWSGLLDAERSAFTLWKEAPQRDSFYIASAYEIRRRKAADDAQQAVVDVHYTITGIGDGHGTRMPSPLPELKVTFNLKKISGSWKISKPESTQLSPVVLESKFPAISGN